jgi:hypothetical protein
MRRSIPGWTAYRLRLAHYILAPLVLLVLLGAWWAGGSRADETTPMERGAVAKGRQWAILIGIEKYQRANPLRFTDNDVARLVQTLCIRGGYPHQCVLEMTDRAVDAALQPLKTSLAAALPQWLQKPEPDDTVLVYFSGHGFRDAAGKMYLAPMDCDPANPAETCIPVEWFRQQIAACRAHVKLLVLDACHAGSEKGEDDHGLTAKELGQPFENLEKVVTLASSTADQKSQVWEERQQSLFSFWLNQGLKGHADKDGDGNVDIDELYDYVSRSVQHTADVVFHLPQTPVRIVRSGVLGVPVVVRLHPQTLRQLLSDVAEQLSCDLQERRIGRVGVLEFTNDTKMGELLGADFGLLGRYCSEELERKLVDQSASKYHVVDRRHLQKALKDQSFKVDDLASSAALTRLSNSVNGMPAVALGTLRNRAGRVVNIQCKLLQTEGDDVIASAGGAALLNESEWAMLGRSTVVKPEDRRIDPPRGDEPRPVAAPVVERIDEHSRGPHPLQDPNFPYRVKIMIDGKERPGVFHGNDMFVPVKKAEVLEIWLENHSGKLTLMRLLVDGLNTLPERETTKGVTTYLVGKRVNLDEARAWLLDPKDGEVNAVRGFVTETGPQGKLNEFVVVDADDSLAARQQFTDQIGLITAAFYAPGSGSRGLVGIGQGQERQEIIEEGPHTQVGNLIAVVNIRYVEAEALRKLTDK